MTAEQFLALIKAFERHHTRDLPNTQVGVQTINGGVPCYHKEPLRTLGLGSDWEAGWLMLYPERPLVVVHEVLEPRQMAEAALKEFIGASKRVGQEYLPWLRADCWIDGFEAGLYRHATACKAPR